MTRPVTRPERMKNHPRFLWARHIADGLKCAWAWFHTHSTRRSAAIRHAMGPSTPTVFAQLGEAAAQAEPQAVSLEAVPFSGVARTGLAGTHVTSACAHGPEGRCLNCGAKEATGAVKCGYLRVGNADLVLVLTVLRSGCVRRIRRGVAAPNSPLLARMGRTRHARTA